MKRKRKITCSNTYGKKRELRKLFDVKSKASAESEASEQLRPPGVSPAVPDYEDHSAVCEKRVGAAACASVCMSGGGRGRGKEREKKNVFLEHVCVRHRFTFIFDLQKGVFCCTF